MIYHLVFRNERHIPVWETLPLHYAMPKWQSCMQGLPIKRSRLFVKDAYDDKLLYISAITSYGSTAPTVRG